MDTKICKKCGEEKPLSEFYKNKHSKDGYKYSCKSCEKKYVQENKERFSKKKKNARKKYYEENPDYNKNYYIKNKEKIKECQKRYEEANKDKLNKYRKQYRKDNAEKIKNYAKTYRETHREERNIKTRERLATDKLFKIKINIGGLIRQSFKRGCYKKTSKTAEIIGCTFEEFKAHIEAQFEPWMNWDNYGKYNTNLLNYGWDLDHIIPVSSAKTEEELIKLNHYTNFQPLCSYVNRNIKKDKIIKK